MTPPTPPQSATSPDAATLPRYLLVNRILASALVGCVRLLPLSLRRAGGTVIAATLTVATPRERSVIRAQVRRFLPSVTPTLSFIFKVYRSVSYCVAESFELSSLVASASFQDRADFDHFCKSSRPTIVMTAHLGNWEFLAAYALANGAPLLAVAREARNPFLQELLRELRERNKIPVQWRTGVSSLRTLQRKLRNGAWIGALIDQDTRVNSVPSPFFGEPAMTPSTLIELGVSCNARFAFSVAHRRPDGRFEVEFHAVPETLQTIPEILAHYHQLLERSIRRSPTQWVWFHKRWRTTPDGERISTKRYIERLAAESAVPHTVE